MARMTRKTPVGRIPVRSIIYTTMDNPITSTQQSNRLEVFSYQVYRDYGPRNHGTLILSRSFDR